ncbi:ATP-binding cassette domain-containing protein [Salinisphaera orenii]|uniref:ATP-binding cassette domain-containing protein n=1 Tax=Salinisphaera orenii TaxID=856731 RepID=UPI0019550F3A
MIEFSGVGKQYGDGMAAIESLDMTIATGELTVLAGPSGCGKTTTLRLINRLEEATSGIVSIDGMDVRAREPTELRRSIGYVMQHSGLFPHRTVRDNIATVPHLLSWSKAQIAQRVDELIETVGLRTEIIDRYPHQLSGGQAQRVGVARALAADPPILLMDEPFAAVDPIVRGRLQREFIQLQEKVEKTIVFVTHDIDEAISLGDRIALFETGGRLAQYAPPADVLAAPANGFVADFLGGERELRRLALMRVAAVETEPGPEVTSDASSASALAAADRYGWSWVVIVGDDGQLIGWVACGDLIGGDSRIDEVVIQPFGQAVSADDTLRTALGAIVTSPLGVVPRVDGARGYAGLVTHASLNQKLA